MLDGIRKDKILIPIHIHIHIHTILYFLQQKS